MARLIVIFCYSFFLAIILSVLFPDLKLSYFAPFIILSYYSGSAIRSLWHSLLAGTIIDLFAANSRFGSYALVYCLTGLFLYRYKYYFFEDRPTTLPIMTYLFVIVSTFLQALFYQIFEGISVFSFEWFKNDLLFMPPVDALFAWLAFTLPLQILSKQRKAFRRRKRA